MGESFELGNEESSTFPSDSYKVKKPSSRIVIFTFALENIFALRINRIKTQKKTRRLSGRRWPRLLALELNRRENGKSLELFASLEVDQLNDKRRANDCRPLLFNKFSTSGNCPASRQ